MNTPTGNELHPYQVMGVRRLRDFNGIAILADEMGLGKSLQTLMYIHRFLPDGPGPVVVVCPAHARLVWRDEAMKHLGRHVEVLYKRRVPPNKIPSTDPNHIYVIGDDTLVPPHWTIRTPAPRGSWLAWLLKSKPRLIVADEAHRYSNPTTARTRAVRRLSRISPRRILLTGTPMANKPPGLWSLLNITRAELYPNYHEFCETYTHALDTPWGWQYKGARNLKELHRQLSTCVLIRRRKRDVLDQLPEIQRSIIPLEVDLNEYRKAEFEFLLWMEQTFPTMARRAALDKERTQIMHLRRLAGRLKIKGVIGWVNDFFRSTREKLLLGVIHHAVSGEIMKAFPRSAILVDGTMDEKKKHRGFYKFNHDPSCRLCVGNIDAAGSAWSCTATSDVASCEIPWRPMDLAQFEGRVHGISRGVVGRRVHMRLLVAVGTIEADIVEMLTTKSNWASQAIDGRDHGDFDVLASSEMRSILEDKMKQRHKRRK